jgi:hypothetical protein
MNNSNTNSQFEKYVDEVLVIVKNHLKQQFALLPSYGSIGIDIIFRDGELSRIVSRNEFSTLIGPSSSTIIEK